VSGATNQVEGWIEAGAVKLHYLDYGNTGAVPMVLVHGMCGHAHSWDIFANSVKQHFHVIALDLRGHGESDWSEQYSLRDYVADLQYFIDTLQLPEIVLIGHSLGGVISTVYAANNPGRVKRLVIIDIGPEIKAEGVEFRNREWADEPQSYNSMDEAIEYARRIHPYHADNYIKHDLSYGLKHIGKGRLAYKYDHKVRETGWQSPEWLWDYIKMIVCPALVIHGAESDLLDGEVARRMAATLAFGSVVDIERAAHTVQGDSPEAFESAVKRFLAENK
jgi:esterase